MIMLKLDSEFLIYVLSVSIHYEIAVPIRPYNLKQLIESVSSLSEPIIMTGWWAELIN